MSRKGVMHGFRAAFVDPFKDRDSRADSPLEFVYLDYHYPFLAPGPGSTWPERFSVLPIRLWNTMRSSRRFLFYWTREFYTSTFIYIQQRLYVVLYFSTKQNLEIFETKSRLAT